MTETNSHSIRLTATPFNSLVSPELFVCDLCTSVVTNPQQHFRVHEAAMWTDSNADIFVPFMTQPLDIEEEPDATDLADRDRDRDRLLDAELTALKAADQLETDVRPKEGDDA